MVNRAEGIQMR